MANLPAGPRIVSSSWPQILLPVLPFLLFPVCLCASLTSYMVCVMWVGRGVGKEGGGGGRRKAGKKNEKLDRNPSSMWCLTVWVSSPFLPPSRSLLPQSCQTRPSAPAHTVVCQGLLQLLQGRCIHIIGRHQLAVYNISTYKQVCILQR